MYRSEGTRTTMKREKRTEYTPLEHKSQQRQRENKGEDYFVSRAIRTSKKKKKKKNKERKEILR